MNIFSTFFFLVIIVQVNGSAWAQRRRASRSMIYPELAPTPVTFLCAIGIPVEDLAFETLVSGYALRMQYFLPTNASQVTRIYLTPQQITDRRYRKPSKLNLGSIYRWIIYRAIEMILQNMGLAGHSCLLRVICEHASHPREWPTKWAATHRTYAIEFQWCTDNVQRSRLSLGRAHRATRCEQLWSSLWTQVQQISHWPYKRAAHIELIARKKFALPVYRVSI